MSSAPPAAREPPSRILVLSTSAVASLRLHTVFGIDGLLVMLLHRLVRLVESHPQELASELLNRARHSPHLTSFSRVPDHELRQRVHEIYGHLGQWLTTCTGADVARQYSEVGARRYRQGVLLGKLPARQDASFE